jgi:flagellar basal body P-ring formation protein FlgA
MFKNYCRHLSILLTFVVLELPFLAFLLITLGFMVPPAHGAENSASITSPVTLKAQTTIDRADIMLSDVFTNLPAGLDRAIAVAPLPGKKVVYDVNVLSRLSEKYRLDWRASLLTEQAVLMRAANRIEHNTLVDAARKALADSGVAGEIEISLDNRNLAFDLPTDIAPDFVISNLNYDPASNRFTADLAVAPTSAAVQHASLTGRAVARLDVPVLARPMAAGDIIAAEDIMMIKLPADRISEYVRTNDQLIGKELRRAVAENIPLRTRDVMAERLVTRGTLVTMKVETPTMLITTQGRAMQDGSMGEVIRIINTQSQRVVEATVMGNGLVGVTSGQNLASKRMAAAERIAP